jgi:basic amino acid/polyamine antiporter, APA family
MTARSPTSDSATSDIGPRRQLGLASAAAVVAGEAIAVGIFLTPAGMARALGSPFWLLLVWLAVGAITLGGALCFGELAGRFPRTGGQYVYLEAAFGRRVAFLFGWMSLLVLDPGLAAALATGLGSYAAVALDIPAATRLVALASIVSLCVLNALSIKIGAGVLRWITWLKFVTLAVVTVWALAFHLGSLSNFRPFVAQRPGSVPLTSALAAAIVGAFFAFGGWWDASKIAGEIRDPARVLPRAMVIGVTAVTAVYIMVSGVFVYLIPMDAVTSDETFVAQAGAVLFGPAGGVVLAAIVTACIFGSLSGFIMTAPRVYFAMAQDGLFLKPVARLHPRLGTPVAAIGIQGMMAACLIALGTFQEIVSYFMFAAVAFLGLTVGGLFLIRLRAADTGEIAIVRTPGYPLTPAIFLALITALLVLLAMENPAQALVGTLIVSMGVPVYRLFERNPQRRHGDTEAAEGG